jgi:flavin reductase (DIM6/NTAB) family NADH-FMN oxidoreductase RutF
VDSVVPEDFKAAMASFAAGVTIVTTLNADATPQAMTATAFSSVSLNPPLCLVCIDRRSRAYVPLLRQGCFAVNILSADQQAISDRFASAVSDRFADVHWRPGVLTACPVIVGALAVIECRLTEVHAGGDHDIILGQVHSVQVREGRPLVYWRGRYSSLPAPPLAQPRNQQTAVNDG